MSCGTSTEKCLRHRHREADPFDQVLLTPAEFDRVHDLSTSGMSELRITVRMRTALSHVGFALQSDTYSEYLDAIEAERIVEGKPTRLTRLIAAT